MWRLNGRVHRHALHARADRSLHDDGFPAATHSTSCLEAHHVEAYVLLTLPSDPSFPIWELSSFRLLGLPSPSLWTPVLSTGG